MQGTIKARTKVMRDLKSIDTANTIMDGFIIHYNYFRPHETLSTNTDAVTPAEKAHIKFPYDNWEALIRHKEEAKAQSAGMAYRIPDLPVIDTTRLQRKRMNDREVDRMKAQARRLGIPYTGRRTGRPRKSETSLSRIQTFRNK